LVTVDGDGLARCGFHAVWRSDLSTCQVPKDVPGHGCPEINAGMLLCQHGEIGKGFVKDHGKERNQAEERKPLHRCLEQVVVMLAHSETPKD
jgi:hypothetical protein